MPHPSTLSSSRAKWHGSRLNLEPGGPLPAGRRNRKRRPGWAAATATRAFACRRLSEDPGRTCASGRGARVSAEDMSGPSTRKRCATRVHNSRPVRTSTGKRGPVQPCPRTIVCRTRRLCRHHSLHICLGNGFNDCPTYLRSRKKFAK